MKRKNIIRWLLLIIWMVFIFLMSNTNGDKSSDQSQSIVNILCYLGIDLHSSLADIATFIVRKAAHFTEYLILYILFYRVLILYINENKSKFIAIILVFLYACTDEFHQLFVQDRDGNFRDVCIDTSGGIFGLIILSIINKVKNKVKRINR